MTKPESHPMVHHTSVDVLADVQKSRDNSKRARQGAIFRAVRATSGRCRPVLLTAASTLVLMLNAGAVRADEYVESPVVVTEPWDIDGTLVVGTPIDPGGLFIESGGQVTSDSTWIAWENYGLVQVQGAGTTWTTGELYVGHTVLGELEIFDGATVFSDDVTIGSSLGFDTGLGNVSVEGAETIWDIDGGLYVGGVGLGTLTISNGATVTSKHGHIGSSTTFPDNTVVVSGEGTWTLNGDLLIGVGREGTLEIDTGGTVATAVDHTQLGVNTDSHGELLLNGQDGERGVLETGQVVKGDGTADIAFAGGILRATRDEADFLSGFAPGDVTLNVGDAFFDSNSYDIGVAAPMGGSGRLVKQGAGTLTLTGANSYNGGTTIADGTLRIGNGGTSGSITGDVTNDAALVFDRSDALTFGGDISGTGRLTQQGAGTLTLTGTNTYSGGTTINAGTLDVDGGSISHGGDDLIMGEQAGDTGAVTITNGGAVTSRFVYVGDAAGSNGAVTVAGAGSIWTSATNFQVGRGGSGTLTAADGGIVAAVDGSYSAVRLGVSSGASGTLNIGEGGAAGVVNASQVWGGDGTATLNFNHTDADYFFTRNGATTGGLVDIRGSTTVNHIGAGTTTLTGTNTYTGTTTVEAGTLRAGSAAAFAADGAYTVNGGTLDLNDHDLTMSALDGTGGTVALGGAALTVDQASDTTYAGAIAGTGSLTQQGAGTLELTGDSSGFAGQMDLNHGVLLINGQLGGAVQVNDGGTLAGSGTVGDLTVASGGTLAPGNSIGTLNVAGDYTLGSGATYEVELTGGGNTPGVHNDLIAVAGAATLEEGSLIHVTPENGSDDGASGYADGSTYTILTTGGGLTVAGAGPDISDDYAYLDFAGSADADNYYLTASLLGGATSFCLPGQSGNQCATGDGAFSVGADNAVYDALLNMSAEQAAVALNQLSGENHAATQSALLTGPDLLRSNVLARMRRTDDFTRDNVYHDNAYQDNVTPGATAFGMSRTDSADPVWMNVIGGTASLDGNNNAADLDSRDWGFLTGTDGNPDWLDGDWRLGFLAGYTNTRFSIDERSASGESDNLHLGLYGGRQWGPLALRIAATQSWHWIDTERSALGGELSGDTNGRTFQSFGELGYAFSAGDASIEPFINAAYVHQRINSFNERGSFALSVDDTSKDIGFSTLGLRASTLLSLGESPLALHGSLGWRHTVGDITPESSNAFVDGTPFTVSGTAIARDVAVIEAGFDLSLSDTATLGIGYDGQYADDTLAHSGRLQFTIKF